MDDDARIRFALDLIQGGPLLRAIAGPVPERLPAAGAALLDRMDDSPRAKFKLAQASLAGQLDGFYDTDPAVQLRSAAVCGYNPAIEAYVSLSYQESTREPATSYPFGAMAWLWYLNDAGYDTDALIKAVANRHDMPTERSEYETLIQELAKASLKCE